MIEKKWTGYEADRKALAKLKLPLTRAGAAAFRRIIYRYYYENGRRFPWEGDSESLIYSCLGGYAAADTNGSCNS
jgi:hypothetical protein